MLRQGIVFFKQINRAITRGNKRFLIKNTIEDVKWTLAGSPAVNGKEGVINAVKQIAVKHSNDISITHFITHGNKAAVNGTTRKIDESGKKRNYSFCHIHKLNKFKNGMIKEITSFVVEENNTKRKMKKVKILNTKNVSQ